MQACGGESLHMSATTATVEVRLADVAPGQWFSLRGGKEPSWLTRKDPLPGTVLPPGEIAVNNVRTGMVRHFKADALVWVAPK
jgi:hypothetical protein